MVVAYLRGLLKPELQFGVRSVMSEDIILESIDSELMARHAAEGSRLLSSRLPVLNEKGVRENIEISSARLARSAELMEYDLYKIADQLGGKLKASRRKDELSLYQLYHIAEKKGIFDAFDEHYDKIEREEAPLI